MRAPPELSHAKVDKKVRFPATSGFGIKPISKEGTERLVAAAIDFALEQKRKYIAKRARCSPCRSVTIVHKGNIMKFTEGAFRDFGYGVATSGKYRPLVCQSRPSLMHADCYRA